MTFKNRRRLKSYLIYLLTAIGLTPGGSSRVHIYRQTIHRTKQGFEPRVFKLKLTINLLRKIYRLTGKSVGRAPSLCGSCPVFVRDVPRVSADHARVSAGRAPSLRVIP